MLAFRPLLRQTRQRCFEASSVTRRLQHDNYGPHKEYFQNPNQPFRPGSESPSNPFQGQNFEHAPQRPSRFRRFVGNSFYALTAYTLGTSLGVALITWEYLQPPYEKGSEEDLELREEIEETLDSCSLVEGLREADWKEEDVFIQPTGEDALRGRHLLHQTLDSVQGVSMKLFRHPTDHFTILVFFPGFGCEGWPDVVHGGVVASLLVEAVEKHLDALTFHQLKPAQSKVDINFKRPVRPGDIYTILVVPTVSEFQNTRYNEMSLRSTAFLLQLETAPTINVEIDEETKTRNVNIMLPSTLGQQAPLAVANVDHIVHPEGNIRNAFHFDKLDQDEAMSGPESSSAQEDQSSRDLFNQLGAAMQGGVNFSNNSEKPKEDLTQPKTTKDK